ncbi:MAG: hypothetical protein LBH74_05965 [Nitrososphaerota archaeon]|jgi:hypothetical protein|nr:hypothetical protein [Nitrososphaerota archaeon]
MKKQRLREKTQADVKKSKQTTFDRLPKQKSTHPIKNPEKQILIAQLKHTIKEEELELLVIFQLLPTQKVFSNVMLEIFFDDNKLNTYLINIPPSQLLSNELEFPIKMDMKNIQPGEHAIKVEMTEPGSTGKKLTNTTQYSIIQYTPVRRQDRYVKVPIVQKIEGAFRIILPHEKELYQKLQKSRDQELKSKKEQW